MKHARRTVPVAAVLTSVTALLYLLTWIAPGWFGPGWTRSLSFGVLVEFLLIHATAMAIGVLGLPRRGFAGAVKVSVLIALAAFYFGIAFWLSHAMGDFTLVAAMLGLAVVKLPSVAESMRGDAHFQVRLRAVGATALYVALGILALALPVPRLGVTPAYEQLLPWPGSGVRLTDPWRFLALGVVYFGALAAFEWRAHAQVKKNRGATGAPRLRATALRSKP